MKGRRRRRMGRRKAEIQEDRWWEKAQAWRKAWEADMQRIQEAEAAAKEARAAAAAAVAQAGTVVVD